MIKQILNFLGFYNQSNLEKALLEKYFLVDVRTASEFKKGSVSGAVNVPLNNIEKQLLLFENKKNIIVFCQSGIRSRLAKNILKNNHFTNVINAGTYANVQKTILKLNKNVRIN